MAVQGLRALLKHIRLKDFQRIANRYDKLAANFLSGVALATDVAAWL